MELWTITKILTDKWKCVGKQWETEVFIELNINISDSKI